MQPMTISMNAYLIFDSTHNTLTLIVPLTIAVLLVINHFDLRASEIEK